MVKRNKFSQLLCATQTHSKHGKLEPTYGVNKEKSRIEKSGEVAKAGEKLAIVLMFDASESLDKRSNAQFIKNKKMKKLIYGG